MRVRKSQVQRRSDILLAARTLFAGKGYGACQMEDIRHAAGLSRGGLYHHFSGKLEILNGLVEEEILELVPVLEGAQQPLAALIQVGSSHLGNDAGIVSVFRGTDELGLYVAAQERAMTAHLMAPLREAMAEGIRCGRYARVDAGAAADLFLATNAHLTRRVLLDGWTDSRAATFVATALVALSRLLDAEEELAPVIESFRSREG